MCGEYGPWRANFQTPFQKIKQVKLAPGPHLNERERKREMQNMVIEFIPLLLTMAALQIKFFQI